MDTLYALMVHQRVNLMAMHYDSPERRHRAAALAARGPWHQRFARQARRLKLLASQSSTAVAAPGSC